MGTFSKEELAVLKAGAEHDGARQAADARFNEYINSVKLRNSDTVQERLFAVYERAENLASDLRIAFDAAMRVWRAVPDDIAQHSS